MPERPWRLPIVAPLAWLLAGTVAWAQEPGAGRPTSLFDPRLAELRTASVTWAIRQDQRRVVVDQVCLVADLPGFFEAIGTWDESHYFPVLLEDAHFSLEFLRAFRPSRVVRVPGPSRPIPTDRLWEAAVEAVGRAWTADDRRPIRGDRVPSGLDAAGPGVVVSGPSSSTLAGAVTLAAGRFQPLIRWEPPERRTAELSLERAEALAFDLEKRISAATPQYARLGDPCDFITLAGDYPDRYRLPIPAGLPARGPSAFDDLIGRNHGDRGRWAFAGRLVGDPAASVYQAMCSLFLQPRSAILIDGYAPERAAYAMEPAARALRRYLDVSVRAGPEQADLAGWHRAFEPKNRAGLVMVNSHGMPDRFGLPGGAGATADVPPTAPAAVLMIHSFSAADPEDPATLAGRWLAQGAFLYFGSLNEPFLEAFRPPGLVAALLADGLPIGAAARSLPAEEPVFGAPWRLSLLGDPLYRLERRAGRPRRLERWAPTASWPVVSATPPESADDDSERLRWAFLQTILRAARPDVAPGPDPIDALLSIRRGRLDAHDRARFDSLLADALTRPDRRREARERAAGVSPDSRSTALRIALETDRVAELQRDLAAGALGRAVASWDALIQSDAPPHLKDLATRRVAALAEGSGQAGIWEAQLRATLRGLKAQADVVRVEAALRRLERAAPETESGPTPRRSEP